MNQKREIPAQDLVGEVPAKNMQAAGIASLIGLSLVWGAGFVFAKMALNAGLSPATTLLARFGLGALALALVYRKDIRRHFKKEQLGGICMLGVLLYAAYWFQTVGLQTTTPGNNAFIAATSVVMVPFFAWAVTKKRPALVMIVACFVSFCGAAVLSVDFHSGFSVSVGDVFTFIGAALYAMQIVYVSQLAHSIDQRVLVFGQLALCAVLSVCMLPFHSQGAIQLDWQAVSGLLYIGLVCTAFGFMVQAYGLKHVGGALGAIILSFEAVVGCVLSVLMGYEPATWKIALGGSIIMISLLLPPVWDMYQKRQLKYDENRTGGPP